MTFLFLRGIANIRRKRHFPWASQIQMETIQVYWERYLNLSGAVTCEEIYINWAAFKTCNSAMVASLESQNAWGINRIFSLLIYGCEFSVHTCTIKVTFAINSILKLSHKKLSSTKLEKNRNSKVIVKFMKQFCYTQRLIAWHVKNLELRVRLGHEFLSGRGTTVHTRL